ncbi:hypothetical protein FF38_04583 [Lucilia cuprina]|uniref:Uncharacterized protein n=1 Tax=Lucilia cuprina TaxID=7375 RepID=A0A0L0BWA3_LUCCU|nr:hypothetical protein FF38_04583 [Lucilia cuprina]
MCLVASSSFETLSPPPYTSSSGISSIRLRLPEPTEGDLLSNEVASSSSENFLCKIGSDALSEISETPTPSPLGLSTRYSKISDKEIIPITLRFSSTTTRRWTSARTIRSSMISTKRPSESTNGKADTLRSTNFFKAVIMLVCSSATSILS